jgi:hypothetical protein
MLLVRKDSGWPMLAAQPVPGGMMIAATGRW